MIFRFTATYRFVSLIRAFVALVLIGLSYNVDAQVNVTDGYTPAQMAAKLTGPGVSVFNATMTCPGTANGQFVTVASVLGLDSGIVLTTGTAKTTLMQTGVNGPVSFGFGIDNLAPGDPDLTVLAGQPTNDACILEFDFKPAGDTVSFKYVFGSAEYTSFTCTQFNDVFGFLISGGSYSTPTNIAKVPGTTIPVCINSVNCGPTGGGDLPTCTALGPGSPFCAYYVDNSAGTTISYAGLTVPLLAVAEVSPCDTYHLKLGIADAFDGSLDSGVFIEAGSLTSTPPVGVSGIGLSGLPYVVRGCAGGVFQFSIPVAQDTPVIVHYNITGTAVNGYDYATIPTIDTIPPFATSTTLNINPLMVPVAGPKTLTLEVLVEDPCHPGVFVSGAFSTITILDSFSFHIITPDTVICRGEFVHAIAQADTMFGSILNYTWSPAATVSNPVSLTPDLTPTTTTTYVLTESAPPSLGCPDQRQYLRVRVYERPTLTTDSVLIKTCVGIPVQINVRAMPDTIPNTFVWNAGTYLNNNLIANPIVTPLLQGNFVYTLTANPTAVASCTSTQVITVHTIGDFIVNNPTSIICLKDSVIVDITGSNEISYAWTPATNVVPATSMNPVIKPTAQGDYTYTVTGTYANCPAYVHTLNIHVDTPATPIVLKDTICLGMVYNPDFTVPGTGYYHYQWISNPVIGFSNDTLPNPVITADSASYYTISVTIQPLAAACVIHDSIYLKVLPNVITVRPTDTAICLGNIVQVIGVGDPNFSYQWIPTAGIAVSNQLNTLITPDTSALYTVTASFHTCPDIHATLNLDVQPNPTVYIGGNRPVCQFDTLHILAHVSPAWYTGYTYTWSPSADLDNASTTTVVFSGATSTNLHLVVTSSAGCRAEDSAFITVTPGNFATAIPDVVFCPHDTAVINPAGDPSLSYHWYPSYYLSDSLGSSPVIAPIASQTYTVVATNAIGCKDTVGFNAIVHPAGVLFIADSITLHPGETYTIEPMTNCSSFTWFPYAGLSNPLISNPTASPDVSTTYIVTGITENGCKAVDSITIFVDEETILAMPNAFTPGTGANSEFKIIKLGIANLNYFRIFNRWGNTIFETKDINEGWDGSWKGEPQPFGTYIYSIQGVTSTGKVFNKTGNVTVIR